VYWFNQQNMSTQWERPDPLKTDIEQAVKEAKGPEAYKSYVVRILLGFGTSCTRYGKKLSPLFFLWKIICKTVQRSAFSWGVHKKQRAHVVFMGLANSATPGGDA